MNSRPEQIREPLNLEAIQNSLHTAVLGRSLVEIHQRIDSTNKRARELALAGAGDGTLVLAESQTAGRGRLNRAWHSPEGLNIYLSLVLRPEFSPASARLLTLAACLALAETISRITGRRPDIKWPNDLLLDRRKISGILAEMEVKASRVLFVVVGVGLNVNLALTDLPDELAESAGSLLMATGRTWDRNELAASFLDDLEEYCRMMEAERMDELLRKYRSVCVTLGQPVEFIQEGVVIQGAALDIDGGGELIVRQKDTGRLLSVSAGEVSLLKKPAAN